MEEALRALLQADAGLSATGATVDWGRSSQTGSYPAVVLTLTSGAEGHDLKGPDGIWRGGVQADCYATSYSGAETVSRAVEAALDGHRGGAFLGVFLETTRGALESGVDDVFRMSMDFTVIYRS